MRLWDYAYAWGRNGYIYKAIDSSSEKAIKLPDYISALGRDGWELCATLPERDGWLLVFKRPAEE